MPVEFKELPIGSELTNINVNIPERQRIVLEEIAKKKRTNRSQVLRDILEEFVQREGWDGWIERELSR